MNPPPKPAIFWWLILAAISFWGFLAIFFFVVATGQTFGQRAADKYPYGTPEWKAEVERLANGGE